MKPNRRDRIKRLRWRRKHRPNEFTSLRQRARWGLIVKYERFIALCDELVAFCEARLARIDELSANVSRNS